MATIAELFAIDTKTHRLEIAQDDGLYRHLRFRAHTEDGRMRSNAWFDLITVPGTLTFVGDYDAVTFRRLPDMFEFFRGSVHRGEPNFGYWAEKVASGGPRSVEEYSEDVFRQVVKERVTQDIRDGETPRGLALAVRDLLDPDSWEHDITYESGARAALDDFDHEGYRFEDTWEWSFKDYSHAFKWACHGIAWGIRQYDQAKASIPAAA
ncbi:hypothetical protein AB0I72_00605 [Nocardiopsis sp. NPDC049922]|uniref:hypothetical protein n=1 Tax=Nocardiopsis sp. NPDC049922 TaxID=3155157 RepID=UPI0033D8566E